MTKTKTKTKTEIFAFLKARQEVLKNRTVNLEMTTTYVLKNDNCRPLVNALGLTIAEVWSVPGGYDVWYDMKDNCNIFNPRFKHRKAFRGNDAEIKMNAFCVELI